jgi:hypothetical protein
MQGHGNEEINGPWTPESRKCLPAKGTQRPGKRGLFCILEPVNGLHEAAVIDPKGPGLSKMLFFRQALRTSVVFSLPGDERKTALRAKRRSNPSKVLQAGRTEVPTAKICEVMGRNVVIGPLRTIKGATNKTFGRENSVQKTLAESLEESKEEVPFILCHLPFALPPVVL